MLGKKIQGLFPQTFFYGVYLTQLTPKLTITWTNLWTNTAKSPFKGIPDSNSLRWNKTYLSTEYQRLSSDFIEERDTIGSDSKLCDLVQSKIWSPKQTSSLIVFLISTDVRTLIYLLQTYFFISLSFILKMLLLPFHAENVALAQTYLFH